MATLALLGYGRMGREIERLAGARGHTVALRIVEGDRLEASDLSDVDVAIDFSTPAAAPGLCRAALAAGVAVVSGTTGWDVAALLKELAGGNHPAFLHATNMSPGVNAVFAANRLLARVLGEAGGYGTAISETHHVHKLDAPSGTAITLAEGTIAGMHAYRAWDLTAEHSKDHDATTVPIRSQREGEVFGDHEVVYSSEVDEVRLSHSARSRGGFALGAVLAAEFVVGRRGRVTMAEVLGITG